jgi:SAM-dependent methyltransferase
MNTNRPSDVTLGYYDAHAEEFCTRTRDLAMEMLYPPFLALLPVGAHILDAGSGSGRDTRAFLTKGYRVTAFDGSAELAKRASAWTGIEVLHRTFGEVEWSQTFDGVWACASLLHLPLPELADAVCRLTEALRPSGAFFMSFKQGTQQGERNGRFFADLDDRRLRELIANEPRLYINRTWETADQRGRADTRWINALCTRQC